MTYFRILALSLALSAPIGIAMYGSGHAASAQEETAAPAYTALTALVVTHLIHLAAAPRPIDQPVNPAGPKPTQTGPKPTQKNVKHPRMEVGCPGGKRITTTCNWENGHIVCHPAGSCW